MVGQGESVDVELFFGFDLLRHQSGGGNNTYPICLLTPFSWSLKSLLGVNLLEKNVVPSFSSPFCLELTPVMVSPSLIH